MEPQYKQVSDRRLMNGIRRGSLAILGAAVIVIYCLNVLVGHKHELIPVTLFVMWEPQAQFLGYYSARDRGFFRDEGLDVTIKHDLGVGESFYEVLSNPRVYTINILSNTMEWLAENPKFSVISIISKGCNMGWVSKGPKDQILHKMKTSRFFSWWGSQDTLLKNFLIEHHLISSDFAKRANVGSPDVRSDDWIVLVMRYNELLDYSKVVNPDQSYSSYCEMGQPIFEDVLVGRKPTDAADIEINRRMAKAIWKGWDWTEAHPNLALDILMKLHPRRPRHVQQYQLKTFTESLSGPSDYTTSYSDVLRTMQQLLKNGLIKNAGNAGALIRSMGRHAPLREIEPN